MSTRSYWICAFLQTVLLLLFNSYQYVYCWNSPDIKTKLIREQPRNTSDNHTLLLISFDGFRWDYIQSKRARTPNFDKIIGGGVSVQHGLKNAFITKTFPNHFTIATGLWEESHGIVANEMYDPHLNETFTPQNASANNDPAWFDVGAEPIWVTNQLQDKGKSGVCMWVGGGSPIKNVTAYRHIAYNETMGYIEKVDKVIEWFIDKDPINLGLLYFDQPDRWGHKFGPGSDEVTQVIEKLDGVVGYLLKRLNETNLLQNMNIIMTSDHGFTNTPYNKIINLDRYISEEFYNMSSVSPVALIWPKEGQLDFVLKNLTKGASENGHFKVYRKEFIPGFFHYSLSWRISPIIAVADDTYSFESETFPYPHDERGNHGYDNRLQDMHPFFIAMGPSFKKNFSVDTFDNVDIYPLMCHLLHLTPAPNNGSLNIVSQLLAVEPDNLITILTYILSITVIIVVAGVFAAAVCYYHKRSRHIKYTSLLSSTETTANCAS